MMAFSGAQRTRSLVVALAGLLLAFVVIVALIVYVLFRGASGSSEKASEDGFVPVQQSSSAQVAEPASASAVASEALEVADGQCVDSAVADRSSAQSVAKTFMQAAFCWDSVLDSNTVAAQLRASDLVTEKYQGILLEQKDMRNSLEGEFAEARSQKAYTKVNVQPTPGDFAGEQSGKVLTGYIAQWSWVSRTGSGVLPGGRSGWDFVLVQDESGQWAVDEVHVNFMEED